MSSNSQANWPPSSGGGGSPVTGASNVGAGVGVFKSLSGTTLQFKSVTNGTGITWAANVNDIQGTVSLASFSTTNLAEGTNLYFTNERTDDRVAALIQNGTGITWTYNDPANTLTGDVSLGAFSTTNLAEGTNLYFTAERVDDRVAALVQNGTGLTWTYNDPANTFTGNVSLAPFTTTDLAEGANLYFTTELAQDAVGGGFVAPLVYNDGANTFSITQSGVATDGYLSSTDWNTFNNKQDRVTIVSVSSNISLVATRLYLVNTSAARTLTLPSPVSGARIIVKDFTGGAVSNPIALTPFGGEKIDGTAAAYPLDFAFGSWEIVSDGTDWAII